MSRKLIGVLVGLVVGVVAGLVVSEVVGAVGLVAFDRPVGVRFLPVYLGVAGALVGLAVGGRRRR